MKKKNSRKKFKLGEATFWHPFEKNSINFTTFHLKLKFSLEIWIKIVWKKTQVLWCCSPLMCTKEMSKKPGQWFIYRTNILESIVLWPLFNPLQRNLISKLLILCNFSTLCSPLNRPSFIRKAYLVHCALPLLRYDDSTIQVSMKPHSKRSWYLLDPLVFCCSTIIVIIFTSFLGR